MEPESKRPKVDEDVANNTCRANDVLSLQWVDIDAETRQIVVADVAAPSFSHAFFGDKEEIRGYEDLKVTLSIDRQSFYAMLDVTFKKREDDADDVRALLREQFEYDFEISAADFAERCLAFRTPALEIDVFGECARDKMAFLDGSLILTHAPLHAGHTRLKVLM